MERILYFSDDLGHYSQSSDEPTSERRWPVDTEEDANLVSSYMAGSVGGPWHAPVLDVDFPVSVRESETPGHFHLFLDTPMTWPTYERLLMALAEAGVIEPGFAGASIDRGATFVATRPWKSDSEPTF